MTGLLAGMLCVVNVVAAALENVFSYFKADKLIALFDATQHGYFSFFHTLAVEVAT